MNGVVKDLPHLIPNSTIVGTLFDNAPGKTYD
jgi:hypothetical protein